MDAAVDLVKALLENFLFVFLVLAFVAIVMFLEGLYLTWSAYKSPEAQKIGTRLRALSAGSAGGAEVSILKRRMLSGVPALERALLGIPRVHRLDRFVEQSGLQWTVGSLLSVALLSGLAAFAALAFLHAPWMLALLAALAAPALPFLYVQRRRMKRMRRIERQLPDALDLISRALRAGHAFPSGLQMVGEEMAEPIAGEFRLTHDEVNFGVPLQQALSNLATRVPSTDLSYFVIAVLIQRETGGNLTEVLDNLSMLIRERLKLLEKVRVLAAEGRLSAWILGILPFALTGVINVLNPAFMQVLWTDPMGLKLIGAALVMMFLGILWMRQIIRIHV